MLYSYQYDSSGGAAAIIGIIYMLILLALLGLTIWAIVDICRRTWPNSNDKVVWILLSIFLGWIGVVIYLVAGRKNSYPPGQAPPTYPGNYPQQNPGNYYNPNQPQQGYQPNQPQQGYQPNQPQQGYQPNGQPLAPNQPYQAAPPAAPPTTGYQNGNGPDIGGNSN